jgi:hypothetical protein
VVGRFRAGQQIRRPIYRHPFGLVPHDPERSGELAAAIAISSCEINIQLSQDCLLVALPSKTLFDLPQLWNALLGEMPLVGPCPALPDAMTKSSIMSDVD